MKKVEAETPAAPPPVAEAPPPKAVSEEKTAVRPPPTEEKPDDSKALAVVESKLRHCHPICLVLSSFNVQIV